MEKTRKKIDGVSAVKKKSDDFFSELDKKNTKFNIFWFFLALFFVLVFVFLIYIALQFKREKVDLSIEKNFESETVSENFSDRLKNISSFGESAIIFSSAQLLTASGADSSNFPLSSCRYDIDKDSLQLSGKLKDSIIFWPIKIKLDYSVVGNKFIFIVSPNATENIVVFGDRKIKIEEIINQNLNQYLEENGFIAKNITTQKDQIEFRVIKSIK